ncbi:hypothetical protein [Micromonospora sp. NPDC048830]
MRGPTTMETPTTADLYPVFFGNCVFTPGAEVYSDDDGIVVLP